MNRHQQEQRELDIEDVLAQMRRLLTLRAKVDLYSDDVRRLTLQLRHAKKELKIAGWNLAAAERSARERYGLDGPVIESLPVVGNGQRKKGGKPME